MKLKPTYTTPQKEFNIKLKAPAMRIGWLHAVAALFLFLFLRQCSVTADQKSQSSDNYAALNDTISYYKDSYGREVASKLSLQGQNDALEAFLDISRDSTEQMKSLANRYRNIAAAAQVETRTNIKDIEVPYEVPDVEFNVPFNKRTDWYGLSGRSTHRGLFVDSLSIWNTQSIVLGDKKSGFLKPTEFRFDIVNSNPYIKTTGMNSYVHKERARRFGLGVFVGYGASSEGLSPIVGVGLSYNLLRF